MPTNAVQHHQAHNNGMAYLKFVNFEQQQVDPTRQWKEGLDPVWEKIYPGLNLKGKCNSENNPCSGKTVWIPMGFSGDNHFNMNTACAKASCIGCKTLLENVENVHLINCRVEVEGRKDNSTRIFTQEIETTASNSALSFAEEGPENFSLWRYLNIKVTKVTKVPKVTKEDGFWNWLLSVFK